MTFSQGQMTRIHRTRFHRLSSIQRVESFLKAIGQQFGYALWIPTSTQSPDGCCVRTFPKTFTHNCLAQQIFCRTIACALLNFGARAISKYNQPYQLYCIPERKLAWCNVLGLHTIKYDEIWQFFLCQNSTISGFVMSFLVIQKFFAIIKQIT